MCFRTSQMTQSSGPSRARKARQPCPSGPNKFYEVSSKVTIKDKLSLIKERFKIFRKNNDGMPNDEASIEFDEEYQRQGHNLKDKGDREIIKEDGIERERATLRDIPLRDSFRAPF